MKRQRVNDELLLIQTMYNKGNIELNYASENDTSEIAFFFFLLQNVGPTSFILSFNFFTYCFRNSIYEWAKDVKYSANYLNDPHVYMGFESYMILTHFQTIMFDVIDAVNTLIFIHLRH